MHILTDACIESLVVRGAMLMSKFLQGDPSDSFSWLNPSNTFSQKGKSAKKAGKLNGYVENPVEERYKPRRGMPWGTLAALVASVFILSGGGAYIMSPGDRRRLVLGV